jgi:hypothetical protein
MKRSPCKRYINLTGISNLMKEPTSPTLNVVNYQKCYQHNFPLLLCNLYRLYIIILMSHRKEIDTEHKTQTSQNVEARRR